MQYPREIYKSGQCRVIWGPEEHAAAKRDGWLEDKPADNSSYAKTEEHQGHHRKPNENNIAPPTQHGEQNTMDPIPKLDIHPQAFAMIYPPVEHQPKRRGRPPRIQQIDEVA